MVGYADSIAHDSTMLAVVGIFLPLASFCLAFGSKFIVRFGVALLVASGVYVGVYENWCEIPCNRPTNLLTERK